MATHLIAFSCSLLDDARRPPSTQCAHSAPFNPASVLLERMSVPPHVRGVCLWLAHRQGRRERGRARLSWASFRGHRDRDDGGQDAEGEGAEQHRLDFYLGDTDASTAEPSGNVLDRPDRCSSTPSSCPSCRASRAGGFRRHNWRFRRSPAAQPFGSSACSLRRLN